MTRHRETDLYPPVKAHLEAAGFEVKSEVGAADVMGLRGGRAGEGEAQIVIVELKTTFSLTLLQQAVARQAVTDMVYVAVPRWSGKAGWRAFKANTGLCKRLGLGVLSVDRKDGKVQVHADPTEFRPRKSRLKRDRLLSEFSRRDGDPNMGGTRGSIVTAYQQGCERIAAHLAQHGPSKGAVVAKATGTPHATRMMADNHYGWFTRVETGIYGLTEAGTTAATELKAKS